jgi:hypothetical protein
MANQQFNSDSSFDKSSKSNVYGRKVTPDEVSYRDGYVEGQLDRDSQATREQYAREQISESNGVANGLLIGLVLAAIAGVVGGTLYYYNRTETAPAVVAPASPQPQQRTTIIERTIERTREAAPDVQVPNVQINVPQPSPIISNPATAPAPAESQPASPSEPSSQPSEATDSNKSAAPGDNASENSENQPEGGTQN